MSNWAKSTLFGELPLFFGLLEISNLFLLFTGENDVGTGEECCHGSEHLLAEGDTCSACQQQNQNPNPNPNLPGGVSHKPSHSISGSIVSQPASTNQRPPAIRSNSSSSSLFTVGSSSPGREEHSQQNQKELRVSAVSFYLFFLKRYFVTQQKSTEMRKR